MINLGEPKIKIAMLWRKKALLKLDGILHSVTKSDNFPGGFAVNSCIHPIRRTKGTTVTVSGVSALSVAVRSKRSQQISVWLLVFQSGAIDCISMEHCQLRWRFRIRFQA